MLKTNEDKIVEFLLQCQPGPPRAWANWDVDINGEPFILPSIGGITLNIQVGDPAFGWAGDHLEPGVSCTANTDKPFEHPNIGLQLYSCAGNLAKVVSGKAKGKTGYVIGHHGGSEHIIVEFPRKVKEKLTYDDKIIIHSKGQGLKLIDYPEIKLFNLDPELLHKMKIIEAGNFTLEVPVTTIVPAACMGSGIGAPHVAKGDYDIMTSDPDTVKEYHLDKIRFGDFVALMDHDNRYGRAYRKGAISIGIVVHSNCLLAGHGPGVTTLMTCETPQIKTVIDPEANIADLLGIGSAVREP
jgi:ribosomal protein L24